MDNITVAMSQSVCRNFDSYCKINSTCTCILLATLNFGHKSILKLISLCLLVLSQIIVPLPAVDHYEVH